MIAALLLMLSISIGAQPARDAFDEAWRLVGEGRFAAALDAARAEPQSLSGARARLFVSHQAGDLRGALEAGRAGLARFPEDAWMLDQTAYVALSLHAGEFGAELAHRLAGAALAPGLSPEESQRYAARAERHAKEAAQILESSRARDAALAAARGVVAAVVVAGLAFLGWCAFAPAGQSKSSTPRAPSGSIKVGGGAP